jgi:uncharacterized protein
MKKNSGKKPDKPKATPAQPSSSKKAQIEKPPASKISVVPTTPFATSAASPLSKERKAETYSSAQVDPAPKTETSKSVDAAPKKIPAKPKPGKRPPRSDAPADVKIPSLLLEGDLPPSPSVSGPGARYALAPQPVAAPPAPTTGELPEAYGTGRVFLAARDPHWLYVSWDFTKEQQTGFNAQSREGHLVIRIFKADDSQPVVPEVAVHPESKNWFVHVPFAETAYRAEIGLNEANGNWKSVAISQNTFTPPDAPSKDVTAEFATIPVEVSFQQVVEAVQQFVSVSQNEPLLESVALASEAQRNEPPPKQSLFEEPRIPRTSTTRIGPASEVQRASKKTSQREPIPIEIKPGNDWSAEQTGALTRLIHIDSFRRVWLGSMEITELVRRQLEEEVASIAAAKAHAREGRGARIPDLHISSPAGGEFPRARKFWFKINAELIIYGATESDAKVTIADRPIKLRPDGTFSFRFSLPDGRYQLPTVAVSSDGVEVREARLEFSRSTDYRGRVEHHPQDSHLRPPQAEHLK